MKNTNAMSWQQGRSMIWNLFAATCRSGQTETLHRLPGRAAAVLLLAAGFCLLSGSLAMADAPRFADYAYRRSITIDHTKIDSSCGATVSGFPVLVEIRDDTLKYNAHVKSFSGYDIVFTDADLRQLNHEVERYYPLPGRLVA
jgi:hypothetical protein